MRDCPYPAVPNARRWALGKPMGATKVNERTAEATAAPECARTMVAAGEPVATALAVQKGLGNGPHALVLHFAAPGLDRIGFASAMKSVFPGTPVVGCTTAGEIGPAGLAHGTVSALALPAGDFLAVHTVFPDVRDLLVAEAQQRVHDLVAELKELGKAPRKDTTFALLLVDGLSMAEELLTTVVHQALGDIPLVGGSAGDGVDFRQTHVFADGFAHGSGAVLVLVQTTLPFTVFKTQHFVPGDRRLVVTAADCPRRVVHEIDGEPAAACFARMIDSTEQDLDPVAFATHPVVVRIGGADYVRAIQKAGPDGSLTFFCAIEEGVVLRDARGVDLVDNLAEAMQGVRTLIGKPQATIVFDCILRGLECQREGTTAAASAILRDSRCTGFSTYGEQFHGMHVNQTLTGVAIGRRRP